jgi:DNA-binding IclR family transcriptional regulator
MTILQSVVVQGSAGASTSMVARVAVIMEALGSAGQKLRLDEVVSRTGLPRSSTHRILTQLHEVGLLLHGPDGYRVAAASLPATHTDSQLRSVAAPVLERLHSDTALVVQLGVLVGAEVVYLDKLSGASGVSVPTRVAGRTPAHASALGKAMLATLPPEDVDAMFTDPLRKLTAATIADLTTLHQELARIRSRHGLAYDDEELAVGFSSIAAPITLADNAIAGLSLTGATTAQRLTRTAPFVSRAARRISDQMDHTAATSDRAPPTTVTDDMLSRVLRTLSSDDWV